MSLSNKLFRKAALERLASPERLDQLIKITSPAGWLTLGAIIFLILVTIVWGFLGKIPTTVKASGILTRTGGLYSIQSPSNGIILSINVNQGDIVKAGEVVARLSQVDVLNQIKRKKQELDNLIQKNRSNEKLSHEDMENKLKIYDEMVTNLDISIEDLKNHLEWLREQLKNKEDLFKMGLITKDRYLEAQNEVNAANLSLKNKKNEINKILSEKFEMTKMTKLDKLGRKNQLKALQLDLQLLQIDLILNSQVFSPYEGRIMDINFKEGNLINKGSPILTLEKRGKNINNLKAVLYIQPLEAKNVKIGMKVHLVPSHVKQAEHGYMLGLTTFVSDYPVTQSSMMKELENQTLVTNLSSLGALYKFEATIIPDPNTVNGYKWSTPHGYPYEINSGSLCQAQIVVKEQRPISLVVPLFKRYILGIGNE
jgi:HlyD family secretion protein